MIDLSVFALQHVVIVITRGLLNALLFMSFFEQIFCYDDDDHAHGHGHGHAHAHHGLCNSFVSLLCNTWIWGIPMSHTAHAQQ